MTRTAVAASLVLHTAALAAVCIPFGGKGAGAARVQGRVTSLLRPPQGEQPKGPRSAASGRGGNPGAVVDLSQIEVVLDDGQVGDLIQVLEDWRGSVTTCGVIGRDPVMRFWLYDPTVWRKTRAMAGIPCADFPDGFRSALARQIAAAAEHAGLAGKVRRVRIGFRHTLPDGVVVLRVEG